MSKDATTQGPQKTEVLFVVEEAEAVILSDTTVFDEGILWVGTGGDLKVRLARTHTDVTFVGVLAGSFLPVLVIMCYSTGTTLADDILVCRFKD